MLQLRVAEMEMNKAHNLIEHRDEILSRPARVWFTEDSKKKAQQSSKTKHFNVFTVEPLLKDTPNKGHNTFDLSIKDKFYGPYRTMAIQFYL